MGSLEMGEANHVARCVQWWAEILLIGSAPPPDQFLGSTHDAFRKQEAWRSPSLSALSVLVAQGDRSALDRWSPVGSCYGIALRRYGEELDIRDALRTSAELDLPAVASPTALPRLRALLAERQLVNELRLRAPSQRPISPTGAERAGSSPKSPLLTREITRLGDELEASSPLMRAHLNSSLAPSLSHRRAEALTICPVCEHNLADTEYRGGKLCGRCAKELGAQV